MSIGKHLATFNLFREPDGSLWVTCADAQGVREELGDSGAPLQICAFNALQVGLRNTLNYRDSPTHQPATAGGGE